LDRISANAKSFGYFGLSETKILAPLAEFLLCHAPAYPLKITTDNFRPRNLALTSWPWFSPNGVDKTTIW
jgi:hypothetical protein